MIKWLVKAKEEPSLAWLAVVLPLASLGFWIPGALVLAPLQFLLSERACLLATVVVFLGWMVFVPALWFRAIKVIKQAKSREVSPGIFHVLQVFGVVFFGGALALRGEGWIRFAQWVFCMDIALSTFYLSYLLLALMTLTKIPWQAVTGFAVVILSLAYEVFHNPFKNLF